VEFSSVRVGDDERSSAIDRINEHFASGRLSVTETDVRVSAALEAQTVGDLHVLTSDLPRGMNSASSARGGWWRQHGTRIGFPAFCLVAGAAATTAATDSIRVGVISLIAGTCGVVLGRFSKGD
jgi:Domain of unknown function (DUF1707)